VTDLAALEPWVASMAALPAGSAPPPDWHAAFTRFLDALERGAVRAATRDADGTWRAVPWVKQGILIGFRFSPVVNMSPQDLAQYAVDASPPSWASDPRYPFHFADKGAYPTQAFPPERGIRVVPGGSTVRRGAYLARGVVCMPPMYVNVGAWIGEGTMIDSHALVGSCAQVGARVHLSAAAQVGGVLEPVNASPVVIEDDVIVGGNCGVYEGTVVRTRAVLGAGVILTRGTPVFDLVHERVLRATAEAPLEIPAGAVVVPGARAVRGAWAEGQGLSLQTPVIVKYRDEKTDLATALEAWLR
jgi:2,3,4,5-tetrahydropyridine-2-carboxylate N-succinyltransferase